jgi:hypothetical protein
MAGRRACAATVGGRKHGLNARRRITSHHKDVLQEDQQAHGERQHKFKFTEPRRRKEPCSVLAGFGSGATMYTGSGWTKAPPLYRLVHVPYCISQLALSPLLLRMLGGKGKLIFLLPRPAIDCGATSDVFSVHDGTFTLCTVITWALCVHFDLLWWSGDE